MLTGRFLMAELLDQEPEDWTSFGFLPLVYHVMCVIIEQTVFPLPSSTYLFNLFDQRGPVSICKFLFSSRECVLFAGKST